MPGGLKFAGVPLPKMVPASAASTRVASGAENTGHADGTMHGARGQQNLPSTAMETTQRLTREALGKLAAESGLVAGPPTGAPSIPTTYKNHQRASERA